MCDAVGGVIDQGQSLRRPMAPNRRLAARKAGGKEDGETASVLRVSGSWQV
jgi:hypothetical protein